MLPRVERSRGQPGGCAEAFQASARVPAAPRVDSRSPSYAPLPKLNRECGVGLTFLLPLPRPPRPGFACRERSPRRLSTPGTTARKTCAKLLISLTRGCTRGPPRQRRSSALARRRAAAPPAPLRGRACPLRQLVKAARRGRRALHGRKLPRLHLQLRGRRRFGCSPCISRVPTRELRVRRRFVISGKGGAADVARWAPAAPPKPRRNTTVEVEVHETPRILEVPPRPLGEAIESAVCCTR